MKQYRKTPIALAAAALCGAISFSAEAAPSVSWVTPSSNSVVRGTLSGDACAVNTSGATRVTFWANNWQINNDYSAPFNCTFDTTRLADGVYPLRAVAYDASGASTEARISITVNNSGTLTSTTTTSTPLTSTTTTSPTPTTTTTTTSPTPTTTTVSPTPTPTTTTTTTTATPPPGSGSLDVWFKSPLSGATISGVRSGANCYVNGAGVSRVQFYLDNTALNADTTMSDGMQCALDTTRFANGTHQLKALAYNSSGATRWDVISVNIQNSTVSPTPTTTSPTPTTTSPTPTTTTVSPTPTTTTVSPTPTTTSPTPTATTTTTATPPPGSGSLDVWFKSPGSGATISGTRSGTSCYVAGLGVTRVQFYMDNTALNSDTTMSDGMQCVLDTTKFSNGTHQLKALAYSSTGATRWDVISVNVQNSLTSPTTTTSPTPTTTTSPTPTTTSPTPTTTSPTPTTSTTVSLTPTSTSPTPTTTSPTPSTASPIDVADILGQAKSNTLFAQQAGYGGQVIGQYPAAKDIPETGINYTALSNGDTLRLGKVADPLNPAAKVFAFQLAPSDPSTSGSKRSEFEFLPNVENGKTYWIAFSANIADWGTLANGDAALFGTQVHSGDSSKGYSPSFALVTYGGPSGGRTFQVFRTYTTSSGSQQSYKYAEIPIRFGQWTDFVFKFRHALDGTGLLQVWMDGQQIVDYAGPIGFNTPGYKDYAKFGYYNWSSFGSSRKVLLRSPVLVQDTTGTKYTPDSLRAFVQQGQ